MSETFLGMADVGPWLLAGLCAASFLTAYFSIVAGTAGGLMLLVIMASFFPPAVLVPMHTLIQLGSGFSRVITMWQYVLKGTLLPFITGSVLGSALGAQMFVALPGGILMGLLAVFILIVTWLPELGRFGPERGRFALIGFVVTFLGMFVSATGTLVGPFVASASADRRNHVSTMSALMGISHVSKAVAFMALGFSIGVYAPLIVAMIATGILGNFVGQRQLDIMREDWFRWVFKVVMTALALRLLWIAARDAGLV